MVHDGYRRPRPAWLVTFFVTQHQFCLLFVWSDREISERVFWILLAFSSESCGEGILLSRLIFTHQSKTLVNVNHTAWEITVSLSPSKQATETEAANEGKLSNHQEDVLFFYLLCTHVFWRYWHSECSRLPRYQNRNQLLGYFLLFFFLFISPSGLQSEKKTLANQVMIDWTCRLPGSRFPYYRAGLEEVVMEDRLSLLSE